MFDISFLNSAILGGLIAGLIPLIIHFFVKYRPKVVKFSSLKFIKQIQQNKARYIKIRQLLLLIIRILIILLVILALSRPVIKSLFTSENWENHAPTNVVMIIDNSFSMNYLLKEETVLDKAKMRTNTILNMLSNKDKIMLLTLDQNFNNNHKYFSHKEKIREEVSEITISENTKDLPQIINAAQEELDRIDVINKEIYILTDKQKNNWQNLSDYELDLKTDIFVMPLFENQDVSNLATINASYIPALLTQKKKPEVRTVIKNFSNRPREDALVNLRINNVLQAEKAVSINANQKKSVVFELDTGSENNLSYAEVSVKDQILPDDNKWYFNFNPAQSPKILVVSNNHVRKELASVLNLITDNSWTNTSPAALSSQIVENSNLLILYEIVDISEKVEYYLNSMLENDKSIMIIPGAENVRGNLENFLQNNQIYFQKLISGVSEINYVNYLHPITSVFSKDMFNQTRIEKMWKISAAELTPLVGTSEGSVLSVGDQFIISALNFTGEWTNFVYQSVFPVLFYNIANYFGKSDQNLQTYEVGVPFLINDSGRINCRLPNGEVVPLIIEAGDSEKFTNTKWQGHYFITNENNETVRILSYNGSRKESDISALKEDQIKNIENDYPAIHFLNDNSWKKNILTSRYGFGLWKIILWIILALLVVEMILAYTGKGSFSKRK